MQINFVTANSNQYNKILSVGVNSGPWQPLPIRLSMWIARWNKKKNENIHGLEEKLELGVFDQIT